MYMKLKDGKSKVLTLSYDDGVVQDIRLIEIMNRWGLKGTFNINTGLYLPEDTVRERYYGRMKLSEAQALYIGSGQEVAVHGLTHPFLEKQKPDEMLVEILEDRKNIEAQYGTLARGMAYPFGTYDDGVVERLAQCGICYSRTVVTTENFKFPENWLTLHPTCHHNNPNTLEWAKEFAELDVSSLYYTSQFPRLFYIWGHTYEFDNNKNWERIDEIGEILGNRDDIWYATNSEICEYVKAYEALVFSADETIVYNPTVKTIWFEVDTKKFVIKAGETLKLDI